MNEKTVIFFKKGLRLAVFAALGICVAAFFAVIFAVFVRLLWNWLMPEIFGLVKITFFQAAGLVVLSRLLVGGWHRGDHEKEPRNGMRVHFRRILDSEYGRIPEEIRMHRKAFMGFWNDSGKKSFNEYRKNINETEA